VRALALAALLGCLAATACASGEPRPATDESLEIFGPYRGIEADRFAETLRPFTERTGIDVRYVGSVDFVDDLTRRVGEGADPPDVAVVPQPGLSRQLADNGDIVPLDDTTVDELSANYPPRIIELAQVDERLYAVPFRLTVKSLVWYRPSVFAENRWAPPTTLAELEGLARRIETDSDLSPWCFGLAAGTASGWAATDWVEDIVLRRVGPDRYRGWATGDVPFSDPAISSAFDEFHTLVLAPGRVVGGVASVIETPVDEVVAPLFDDQSGCALYKQADFATAWMPSGTTVGPDRDVDFFLLPGVASSSAPAVIGGDQVVQFRRGQEIDALMAYLAGPEAGVSWVREGGFISPKSTIPEAAYPDEYLWQLTEALEDAGAVAFDASDQMLPEIGSGLLWEEITKWVAGVETYGDLATTLDVARAATTTTGQEDG